MKTLMQKYFIIKLKKEGWSDRKIAAEYHISRNTIRKYWKQYLESEKELIDRDSDHDTREIVKSFWTGQNMLLPARAISNTTSRWIRRSERSLKMKKERPFCWDIIVLAQ